MTAMKGQTSKQPKVIKLFSINYARDSITLTEFIYKKIYYQYSYNKMSSITNLSITLYN